MPLPLQRECCAGRLVVHLVWEETLLVWPDGPLRCFPGYPPDPCRLLPGALVKMLIFRDPPNPPDADQ